MTKIGKIVTVISLLVVVGIGVIFADEWLVEIEEPKIDLPKLPTQAPPLPVVTPTNDIEGDEHHELITGTDVRGWHILVDKVWGIEAHFPPGWYFTKDETGFIFQNKENKKNAEDPNDFWRIAIFDDIETSPEGNPWESSVKQMRDQGAKETKFNGQDAWETGETIVGNIKWKEVTFRSNGYIYDIIIAINVDNPQLWEDAQYFLSSIKVVP